MAEHGGKRHGAGRKPKDFEMQLAERMDNIANSDDLLDVLADKARGGDVLAIRLWLAYRFGQPKQDVKHEVQGVEIQII